MRPRLARGLAAAGRDVVVVLDEPTVEAVDIDTVRVIAGLADGGGSVTVVAARGIFPAIDPVQSSSVVGAPPIADAVRRVLATSGEVQTW
jgi:hypothetical protein